VPQVLDEIRRCTLAMARELRVVGLMNVQFAVQGRDVYVLEVNPRASRTVPFVSKAIGVPLAKLAAKAMAGVGLEELGFTKEVIPRHVAVKESVLPFVKFPGIDIILGPEMKSTGEAMGIDADFGRAYCKSQFGAFQNVPTGGTVFVSVKDADKTPLLASVARQLSVLGFSIVSTAGTADFLRRYGIEAEEIRRVSEGDPNLIDRIREGRIQLVINTPSGKVPRQDEVRIRSTAIACGVPVVTTVPGADAYAHGISALVHRDLDVKSLQEYHRAR
jgi:carbamoyl-phosphate synthase large subunit